ncbi:hypothetical protein GLYMA_19G006850v4 [Glycine max]|nr:hypothetical protein GLYMA_19G006850v4 [Glycine max]KAH1075803.1 hypothetical protein GYH30_051632 [Glycine max]
MSMFEVLSLISLPLCSAFLVCCFEFQIKNINCKDTCLCYFQLETFAYFTFLLKFEIGSYIMDM